MKKTRIIAMLLTGVILVSSLVSCSGNTTTRKYSDDEVMFTLEGTPFTFDIYKYYAAKYKSEYDIGDDTYWDDVTLAQFKDDMMYELKKLEAISSICKENGIILSEEDNEVVDQQIELFKTYYGEETYNEYLKASYGTEKVHKEILRYNFLFQKLLHSKATVEDIMSYANDNYRLVTHILVSTKDEDNNDLTGEELAAKTALADELYNRAISGEDFASLVETYGDDPGMKSSPEGYFFTYGKMVKEFETTSFELEVGEISEPVKSPFGYHIIKRFPLDESVVIDEDSEDYWNIVFAITEEEALAEVTEYAETIGALKTDAFNALTIEDLVNN